MEGQIIANVPTVLLIDSRSSAYLSNRQTYLSIYFETSTYFRMWMVF